MRREQSSLASIKWDIGLVALVVLILFGLSTLREPTVQPAVEATLAGSRPPDRAEGDILLLLPNTPAAEATNFSELDCSYGWFNSLWQEFGSFATALARQLSPELLAGRSVVIVPRRVAESMPQAGINALLTFAKNGGQVVVEYPVEGWEMLTRVSTSGKTVHATRITSIEGMSVHGPTREHLVDVPLTGRLLPTASAPEYPHGPVLLEIEEQPGLLVHEQGSGFVYTLLIDFGCTVTAMHQGLPDRDMNFGQPDAADELPTEQRVANERMLKSHVPYADLLKHALFQRFSLARPTPRLWPFPGTHAGALLVGHSTADMTRAALGYADWARKQQGVSTIFVAPDRLTPTQAKVARQTGAEIGLLWVNGSRREPAVETIGVGAIRPVARELSLTQQINLLQANLGDDNNIRVARTEATLWHNDWSTTFKQLAAASIRLDHSFGPSSPENFGYLFGTGMPYYPIDDRGLPMPLLEQPFVLNGASISPQRLKRMLSNSQSHFHQALAINLPADAMRREPAPGILLGFRDAFDMARTHNHWITTNTDFVDFLSARRQSVLTSQWNYELRRLTITANIIGAALPTMKTGAVPGIAFPRQFEGEDIVRVLHNGKEIPLRKLSTSGPNLERILDVPPGRHTIQVFYTHHTIPE